jgi:hypothetical protein
MQLSAAPSPATDLSESNSMGKLLENLPKPTPLCRWSIHILQHDYVALQSPEPEPLDADEDVLKDWPTAWHEPSLDQKLQDNLESNDFSSINTNELPIAVGAVATAAQNSPKEIFEEALGFAIIARNPVLVNELLDKQENERYDVSALNPLHLATTYLDGSTSCCQILDILLITLSDAGHRPSFTDSIGHTVLDNLMITILKNHSSVPPVRVDDALKNAPHFPGQEIDICGRWDADSACYRSLLAAGISTVPSVWKHKFCHTAIQAVCHCIESLGNRFSILGIPSGLFLKHCFSCGAKLQLLPLHALVLTAFYLGQFGSDEEDLFGMICCLLCLLSCANDDTDVSQPVEISLDLLLNDASNDNCSHRNLSAAALAEELTPFVQHAWPEKTRLGWQVFSYILRENEEQRRSRSELLECPDSECNSSHSHQSDHEEIFWTDSNGNFERSCNEHFVYEKAKVFGRSHNLGPIWAAAQAELLTYRRLREGDSWCSDRFDMNAIRQSLELGESPSMPLLDDSMLKPFCACGQFHRMEMGMEMEMRQLRLFRDEATAFYFSNLEDWNRTTIIDEQLF